MVRLVRVEDRPTPPEVYSWRIYFNATIATFAAVMIGSVSFYRTEPDSLGMCFRYDSAFIGTSISLGSFKQEFSLVDKEKVELDLISANIVSMYQAGFVNSSSGHSYYHLM